MSVQEPAKPFCNNVHFQSATFCKKGLQKTPAKDIAEEIGVSRRTFYRRFEQIKYKNLDPDTPFSKWI
jgi:hypothetical protein